MENPKIRKKMKVDAVNFPFMLRDQSQQPMIDRQKGVVFRG